MSQFAYVYQKPDGSRHWLPAVRLSMALPHAVRIGAMKLWSVPAVYKGQDIRNLEILELLSLIWERGDPLCVACKGLSDGHDRLSGDAYCEPCANSLGFVELETHPCPELDCSSCGS